jgi:hypothetical protein
MLETALGPYTYLLLGSSQNQCCLWQWQFSLLKSWLLQTFSSPSCGCRQKTPCLTRCHFLPFLAALL